MTILSNGHQWKFSEFIENKNYQFNKNNILNSLSEKQIDEAYSSISKWEGYSPTPLISLSKLSEELTLRQLNLEQLGLQVVFHIQEIIEHT